MPDYFQDYKDPKVGDVLRFYKDEYFCIGMDDKTIGGKCLPVVLHVGRDDGRGSRTATNTLFAFARRMTSDEMIKHGLATLADIPEEDRPWSAYVRRR